MIECLLSFSVCSWETHLINSSTPRWSKAPWTSTSDDRWSLALCTATWRNTTMRVLQRLSRPCVTSESRPGRADRSVRRPAASHRLGPVRFMAGQKGTWTSGPDGSSRTYCNLSFCPGSITPGADTNEREVELTLSVGAPFSRSNPAERQNPTGAGGLDRLALDFIW